MNDHTAPLGSKNFSPAGFCAGWRTVFLLAGRREDPSDRPSTQWTPGLRDMRETAKIVGAWLFRKGTAIKS